MLSVLKSISYRFSSGKKKLLKQCVFFVFFFYVEFDFVNLGVHDSASEKKNESMTRCFSFDSRLLHSLSS